MGWASVGSEGGPFHRGIGAEAKAAQPGPQIFAVLLFVVPETPEQDFVSAITHQNAKANSLGVVMDQVVFEGEIEPE